jgi:hypothetical protein
MTSTHRGLIAGRHQIAYKGHATFAMSTAMADSCRHALYGDTTYGPLHTFSLAAATTSDMSHAPAPKSARHATHRSEPVEHMLSDTRFAACISFNKSSQPSPQAHFGCTHRWPIAPPIALTVSALGISHHPLPWPWP